MAESATVDPFPVQGGGPGKTPCGASLHIASLKLEAPGRVGMRGAGRGLPSIPLESMPPSGYRLPSAAAGSARDLAPPAPTRRRPMHPLWRPRTSGPAKSSRVVSRW